MSKKIYSAEDTAELRVLIGRRVRARRKALGMTQEQVARVLGLSTEFFARIDRGYCLPSVITLNKLAVVLQVSANHLLGIDEEEPPMQPGQPGNVAPDRFHCRSGPRTPRADTYPDRSAQVLRPLGRRVTTAQSARRPRS